MHVVTLREARQYMNPKILRIGQVIAVTGLPRSSVYALARQGRFPKPVPIAGRRVGWSAAQVTAWITQRLNGKAA